VKLNGGLGTSMGLHGPKSLLPVRGGASFLDFAARQVLALRQAGERLPAFYLMNSATTREPSLAHLLAYPALANADGSLDFLQGMVPKLLAGSLEPVDWPAEPQHEWCPPGHGDLYVSLAANGDLAGRLLQSGIRYLFASNVDNLGATVDGRLLHYFVESGAPFMMEVAQRTAADRKGGHLAVRRSDGNLVLRESAQCPAGDMEAFQDIARHRFFNTNSLWIDLEALLDEMRRHGGYLPLPIIRNEKHLVPDDPSTPRVIQLESAMGAAIECFPGAKAVVVPRSRFAPVKTTNDLLAVRSDAYVEADGGTTLTLDPSRGGTPPDVRLDPAHYAMLANFEALFPAGPPSLRHCRSLVVEGPVRFAPGVAIRGDVTVRNPGNHVAELPGRTYDNQRVDL
jgi:UTP--glucose-1-phosphate uridylyltransferase